MSVLVETTAGNLTIDLFDSQPLPSINFLLHCTNSYYFLSPFFGLQKDSSIKCGIPEYPIVANPFGDSVSSELLPAKYKHCSAAPSLRTTNAAVIEGQVGLVSFLAKPMGDELLCFGSLFTISLDGSIPRDAVPFAKVVEGFQVLELINNAAVDSENRFVEDIRITYTHVIHNPYAKEQTTKPNTTALTPTASQLSNMRLPLAVSLGQPSAPNSLGASSLEESEYNALTLELIGDLPHYQIKPSPRTLFIAKLNPITTSDSLEIIFNRFGKVVQSNIIKKQKSATYGFIEFETQYQAELAYSKLSKGCIIDGNEVYVDFSQSVKR